MLHRQILQLEGVDPSQELKELSRSGSDDIILEPDDSNIHKWKAYVKVCISVSHGAWLHGIDCAQCTSQSTFIQ